MYSWPLPARSFSNEHNSTTMKTSVDSVYTTNTGNKSTCILGLLHRHREIDFMYISSCRIFIMRNNYNYIIHCLKDRDYDVIL